MIEVRIPQEEWLAYLGPEQTERLMKRLKDGRKVRVRTYEPCNACHGCTLVNAGLSGRLISSGIGGRVVDRFRSGAEGQNNPTGSGEDSNQAVEEGGGGEGIAEAGEQNSSVVSA